MQHDPKVTRIDLAIEIVCDWTTTYVVLGHFLVLRDCTIILDIDIKTHTFRYVSVYL